MQVLGPWSDVCVYVTLFRRLNDQDFMELVCENGKILAKSRKTNNIGYFQNQRTQSILDLYETEYDESFKKNIKNLDETQVVPVSDEQTNNKNRTSSKNRIERDILKGNKRFESPTLNDDSLNGLKNVEVSTAPPDEQSEAIGRSTKLYCTPSSMLSRGTSRDLGCSLKKRKCGDNEEEETTYLSNVRLSRWFIIFVLILLYGGYILIFVSLVIYAEFG